MDMNNLPDENSKRFIAILNKKIEPGRLMNALGHMTAGLVGGFELNKEICLLDYQDKNDNLQSRISHYPFIVLKADNSNKINNVRKEAKLNSISFTVFTDTMIIGISQDQIDATKNKTEDELEYYGICLFGETEKLKEFTGKFSLYK